MKMLALGDFHGKFPGKLKRKIKKEKFDLILSSGDYCGNEEYAKLFFKYVYGTDNELENIIGKKKTRRLEKDNFESGKKVLNQLNSLGKVIGVTGNWDPTNYPEIGFGQKKEKYAS